MRNKRRTDAEWLGLIQECRSSGFSHRAWCEQNDIPINTFYKTTLVPDPNVVNFLST